MKSELSFRPFGMPDRDIKDLEKNGIRYDRRSRAAYLSEFSSPSVVRNEDIADFELAHSVSLPNDYRDFLLKQNGGKPNKDMVFVQEHGWTIIQHFSPLICRIKSIALKQLIDVTYEGRMPKWFIPIATTPGGSWFVLSIKSDSFGRVFFWDHENESDAINLIPVAGCFSDFLSQLKDNDRCEKESEV